MKRKITAKILIALSCISIMMPFYFIEVKAENPLSVSITISDSTVYWRDDPEDSRYQIGTVYVSINSNYPCTSLIYLNFGTSNAYAVGNIGETNLYSPSGANCQYVEPYVESGTEYGQTWRVSWLNLSTCVFIYEYKVLKTVNTGTHGPIEITYLSMDINDGNMLPSREGLLIQEFELHFLNSNLNQQDIIDLLEQQNQNYLPTIIDMLQQIHGQLQVNGEGAYQSYVYVKNKERLNMTNSSTGSQYYPEFIIDNYFGDGFTLTNTGKIKCNYDGYVIIANNAYYYRYSNFNSREIDVYWTWRKNGVDVTGASKYEYTFPVGYSGGYTGGTTDIVQVQEDDILDFTCLIRTANPLSYMESSSAVIYYLSKDNNLDYTGVLSDQLRYQVMIYETLQDIKALIPTDVQQENITNINTELNIYNQDINTITNNYNTQFEELNEDLDFDDLIDIDPESEHNILNDVNFYNTTFEGLINIPYMKSILIFLLLCILIVALVG